MLETMICIILAPIAVVAAVFTIALGVGVMKAIFKKKNKPKVSEKI